MGNGNLRRYAFGSRAPSAHRMVGIILASHIPDETPEEGTWVSMTAVAEMTGKYEVNVRRSRDHLARIGEIRVEKRDGTTDRIYINWDSLEAPVGRELEQDERSEKKRDRQRRARLAREGKTAGPAETDSDRAHPRAGSDDADRAHPRARSSNPKRARPRARFNADSPRSGEQAGNAGNDANRAHGRADTALIHERTPRSSMSDEPQGTPSDLGPPLAAAPSGSPPAVGDPASVEEDVCSSCKGWSPALVDGLCDGCQ
jgi:hypothetical protein